MIKIKNNLMFIKLIIKFNVISFFIYEVEKTFIEQNIIKNQWLTYLSIKYLKIVNVRIDNNYLF